MIETVIFDMDGVIIDSEPIHQKIQTHLFNSYNISVGPEEYQTYIGRSSRNMWEELIEKYSLSISVEEVLEQDRELYHRLLNSIPDLSPIAGVRELIDSLSQRNMQLILASSSSMSSINLILELFQLSRFFDHTISGADLEFSKPHPEIFNLAASMAGSHGNACLVIEDSTHGISAARSAGMKCIGFQNPNSGNQDLTAADLVIHNFMDLTSDMLMELDTN